MIRLVSTQLAGAKRDEIAEQQGPTRPREAPGLTARDRAALRHQRNTFKASGLTMQVGWPAMKLTTLSNAALKYNS